jgi:Zn-dependent protease/CBS domain-containing protein
MNRLALGGLRIARIFGIPIYVHFSWLIIFGLIAWTLATGYFPENYPDLPASSHWAKGLIASLLFFLSILLHELGHSVVALRHQIQIRSITLFIFGGVAQLAKEPEDGAAEFKIAIAGPLVSFALAGLFYAGAAFNLVGAFLRPVTTYLSFINLILALFNLIPAFPLDGGRILRGLLWKRWGKAKATRFAALGGSLFAYFLIFTGVLGLLRGAGIAGVWNILIGWFLKDASSGAYQAVRFDEALQGMRVRDVMLQEVQSLPAHISLAEAAREYFLHTGYGGYPVERDGTVVGLLCLRDIQRHSAPERETTSVQAAMTALSSAISTVPDEPLLKAATRMASAGIGRLLVLEDGELVGMLTMNQLMRHLRIREQLAA